MRKHYLLCSCEALARVCLCKSMKSINLLPQKAVFIRTLAALADVQTHLLSLHPALMRKWYRAGCVPCGRRGEAVQHKQTRVGVTHAK